MWQDARFSGFQNDSIAFSQSLDGGLTWSDPIKVNPTPTDSRQANSRHSPHPSTWRTTARSRSPTTTSATTRPRATLKTDYFVVHCHPATPTACTNPANWGNESASPRPRSTCVRRLSPRRVLHRRLRGPRLGRERFHAVLLPAPRDRPLERLLPARRAVGSRRTASRPKQLFWSRVPQRPSAPN